MASQSVGMPANWKIMDQTDRLSYEQEFLIGNSLTLADQYAAPIFACFMQAPEGASLMDGRERLTHWWQRFSGREGMSRTQP